MNETTRSILIAYVELYKLAPTGALPPIEEQATLPLIEQCANLADLAAHPEASSLCILFSGHLLEALYALERMREAGRRAGV